jgi:UDP-glucose 4-epimerase
MVYGPGCPGNFARLLRLVRSGVPLPFRSLREVRSFVYVDNLCSFLAKCAGHPAAVGRVFLAADGSDWSVAELTAKIAGALGRSNRCFPFPTPLLRLGGRVLGKEREIDSLTRPMRFDPSDAWSVFGWTPPVDPAEALRETVRCW